MKRMCDESGEKGECDEHKLCLGRLLACDSYDDHPDCPEGIPVISFSLFFCRASNARGLALAGNSMGENMAFRGRAPSQGTGWREDRLPSAFCLFIDANFRYTFDRDLAEARWLTDAVEVGGRSSTSFLKQLYTEHLGTTFWNNLCFSGE